MTPSSFGPVLEQRHCHRCRISVLPPNRLTLRSLHHCERKLSALPHCGKLPQFASTHLTARRNLLVCIGLSVNVPFLRSRGKLGQYVAHSIECLTIDPQDLGRFGDVP